jgi:hypothetical protein
LNVAIGDSQYKTSRRIVVCNHLESVDCVATPMP